MGHTPVEVTELREIPRLILESSPEAILATTSSIVCAIDRLLNRAAGPVVAITHGEVINLYLGQALNIPRLLWFTPAFASISRIHVDTYGHRHVITVNDRAHLEEFLAANG